MEKIPRSFCFSRFNSSISLSLSSYVRCSHPLIIFVAHPWTCSRMCTSLFFTGKPRCGWNSPDMTHQVWAEVKDQPPQPAAIAFLNADHKACINSPYTKSHCCPKVKLLSTRTPRSFSAKLFSTQKSPSLYWGMGLFLPSSRIFLFLLLDCLLFPPTHFSRVSRCLWMPAQPSGASAAFLSVVSPAGLLRVLSVLTWR